MSTDEEEFIVCGDGGTPEDAQFDDLVGVVEDFMFNFDVDEVFERLPPFSSIKGEHERHAMHRTVLARAEADLDSFVLEHCSSVSSMEEAAGLLMERKDEVAEEVWEFISEGCFDYSTFVKLWEMKKP